MIINKLYCLLNNTFLNSVSVVETPQLRLKSFQMVPIQITNLQTNFERFLKPIFKTIKYYFILRNFCLMEVLECPRVRRPWGDRLWRRRSANPTRTVTFWHTCGPRMHNYGLTSECEEVVILDSSTWRRAWLPPWSALPPLSCFPSNGFASNLALALSVLRPIYAPLFT